MVRIGEVDSEVHVESKGSDAKHPPAASTRREDLRDVVRQIVREEVLRYLRTEARR